MLTPKANEILYGGAAGGGKSHGIRAAHLYFACQIPGLTSIIFRKTYPELVANHLQGEGGFPSLLATLVKSGHARIVKGEIRLWNRSRIILSHLQHEKDKYAWQGAEIHLLSFDELTHFSEETYVYLRGRCRLGGLKIPPQFEGMFPRIINGTNPGGIGHVWVKRTFVANGEYNIVKCSDEEGGMTRVFIPALLADNRVLMENDPSYKQKLMGLKNPLLVRAMMQGDWDIVAGSMFGDEWDKDRHTCEPFPIPDDWPLWRGGDDGFSAPASVHWFTEDPKTKTIYVIDELYRKKMRPDDMAKRVLARDHSILLIRQDGTEYHNTKNLRGIYDSSGFADTGTQNEIPRAVAMNNMGCGWEPCQKWPGSRVARVMHFHHMMGKNELDREGMPRLRFFRRRCPNAIEFIPTLPIDKNDPEDVDTDAEDHAFDSVSYGLMWKGSSFRMMRAGGI